MHICYHKQMSDLIVVDTSVLVSALIGKGGASRKVIRECLLGNYVPLLSNTLFQEYEDVISRENIQDICPLTDKETRELVNALYSVCRWVSVYYLWRPNLKDEGDNFLIELAVAGNAKIIVTKNVKDLSGAELHFEQLSILKPEQLIERK